MPTVIPAYSELCKLDLLHLAYAEATERFPPIAQTHAELNSAQKDHFIEELARDLQNHAYHPSKSSENDSGSQGGPAPIRDRTVQAALQLAWASQRAEEESAGPQAESAIQWIARAAEKGLTRVYAEKIELGTAPAARSKPGDKRSEPAGDRALLSLLQEMLTAYPSLAQDKDFASRWFDCVFHGVDTMLEQASLVGKRDTRAPVKCARFANQLIVLVDSEPQFDWVIPGVQHRLRGELSKINASVDPSQTQHVDLACGDKLTFGEFELRLSGSAGKFRASYERAKSKKTVAADPAEIPPAESKKPAVPRRKKPVKQAKENSRGGLTNLFGWLTFPSRAFRAVRARFPSLNVQPFRANGGTFVHKNRNPIIAAAGLAVVVALVGVYVLSSTRVAGAESFHRTFHRNPAGPPLAPYGQVRLDFQTLDESGLRITLPRTRNQLGAVGVRTMFGVRGDFEITAQYEVLQAEKPASGWGAGVMMSLQTGSQESARIGRALDADDKQVFKWDRANQKETGDAADLANEIPSKQAAGSLRLERKGPTLRYFVAEGKSTNFRLVHEEDFGRENIDTFRVGHDRRPSQYHRRAAHRFRRQSGPTPKPRLNRANPRLDLDVAGRIGPRGGAGRGSLCGLAPTPGEIGGAISYEAPVMGERRGVSPPVRRV